MTATLNASAGGVVLTSDTSGNLALQSGGVTQMTIGSGGVTGIEATQAEQEAATSVVKYVTPGRQKFHPGSAKAWISFNGQGTPAILASYNVTSITDIGAGTYGINFTTPFSSANYSYALSSEHDSGTNYWISVVEGDNPPTASVFRMQTFNNTGGLTDPRYASATFFGGQ